ncbi:MAG: flagellar hook basal-body protein [Planctomycetes bacterium]|nr:flagellar hook basal-body protein [Planctomycetota bacterium]
MLLSQRKIRCLVSISLLLICLVALSVWLPNDKVKFITVAQASENQHQLQTGNSDKLRELLIERYDILKAIVEDMHRLRERGRSPGIKKLSKATIAMLYAEADLCNKGPERIKIYEKIVATLRRWEESLAREIVIGQRAPSEVQRIKALRLKAQIKLEKERLAQNTSLNMPNNPVLKTITDARDAIIENITNAHSIAYKKNIVHFIDKNTLVIRRDFSQGKKIRTDRPLDLTISGKGFFNVTDSKGRPFFTRYSSFLVRPNGKIVLDTGEALEPIIFIPKDAQKIHITKDGSVSCITGDGKESVVGAIELSRFPNEEGLEYKGKGLFAPSNRSGDPIRAAADSEGFGHIESGFVESSNVDVSEQIRVLSELSRFEQSVSNALSIIHKEPQWAEKSKLMPAQKPKDKLPVIVHIKTKNEIVTVLSGKTEPLYNVMTKDGKILGQHLSTKELQENLPGIYRLLKTSYADNQEIDVIWAGIELLAIH